MTLPTNKHLIYRFKVSLILSVIFVLVIVVYDYLN